MKQVIINSESFLKSKSVCDAFIYFDVKLSLSMTSRFYFKHSLSALEMLLKSKYRNKYMP